MNNYERRAFDMKYPGVNTWRTSKEAKPTLYQEKAEILAGIQSGILMVTLKNRNDKTDVVIVNSKNITVSDNITHSVRILHYSEPEALELLTCLYKNGHREKVVIFKQEYTVDCIVPEEYTKTIPEDLIPSNVLIKSGGGYSHYIRNKSCEIVDLLMYSPFKQRYQIVRATLDKTTRECYIDISIFRSFIKRNGNPGISLRTPTCNGKRFSFDDVSEESFLHAYGYNVSATDKLRDSERQAILAEIVDLELLPVTRIVFFLDFLLRTHPSNRYYEARSKWQSDKVFIMNYNVNPDRFMIMK